MKHSLLLALALLAGGTRAATAQTTAPTEVAITAPAAQSDSAHHAPRLALGVVGGAAYTSFLGSDATANFSAEYKWGYHAGISADVRLSEQVTLHPEVLYTRKGADFAATERNRDLAYLDVPVLVRFYTKPALTAQNSFYLEAGPRASLLLTAETGSGADAKSEFNTVALGFAMGAGYRLANGLALGLRYDLDVTHSYQEVPAADSFGRGNYQQNGRNDAFLLVLGYSLALK